MVEYLLSNITTSLCDLLQKKKIVISIWTSKEKRCLSNSGCPYFNKQSNAANHAHITQKFGITTRTHNKREGVHQLHHISSTLIRVSSELYITIINSYSCITNHSSHLTYTLKQQLGLSENQNPKWPNLSLLPLQHSRPLSIFS